MSPENTHTLMGLYMEVLVLGIILQYVVSASFKLFPIGLRQGSAYRGHQAGRGKSSPPPVTAPWRNTSRDKDRRLHHTFHPDVQSLRAHAADVIGRFTFVKSRIRELDVHKDQTTLVVLESDVPVGL